MITRTSKRAAFWLLLTLSLVPAWGGAQTNQSVSALGTASIHNNIVDVARDKAVDNALRAAVEQVAGVMVTGSTEVENFQLKMDRVLSESRGFIEKYRIQSEKRIGDNYEVAIEAEVGSGKLQDRLKAMELIVSRKSKPRLMILFSEKAPKDAVAEAALHKFFLAQGFRLIDSSFFYKVRPEISSSSQRDQGKMLSGLARQAGAEIVILGTVEVASTSITVSGIEMNTNKVTLSVKVINGDTGDIITTENEAKASPGAKGDVQGITEDIAGKLAARLLAGTLERWSTELTNTLTVKLVVSGLQDYQQLLHFKEQLPLAVKGFRSLYQRSYLQGEVDLDIEIKGDIQGLADDLALLTLKEQKLKLTEITPNRIAGVFGP